MLAFYGPATLRHLCLSHVPGTPLEIALDAGTRAALEGREKRQRAALALPEDTGAKACAPEPLDEMLARSLGELAPGMLMAHADAIARSAESVASIHPDDLFALKSCRALLGLAEPQEISP
ncbi:hypothetical protein DZK27_14500 [Rhodobacteraceae bacterium 63075]|nr:hypothetical protein DZK27_14500 [Rhodobacteraceae bacterium 63075]